MIYRINGIEYDTNCQICRDDLDRMAADLLAEVSER